MLLGCSGGWADKPTAAADYATPVARDLCAKHMHKAKTSILGGLWEVPHGELNLEEEQGSLGRAERKGGRGGYLFPTWG